MPRRPESRVSYAVVLLPLNVRQSFANLSFFLQYLSLSPKPFVHPFVFRGKASPGRIDFVRLFDTSRRWTLKYLRQPHGRVECEFSQTLKKKPTLTKNTRQRRSILKTLKEDKLLSPHCWELVVRASQGTSRVYTRCTNNSRRASVYKDSLHLARTLGLRGELFTLQFISPPVRRGNETDIYLIC